MSDDKHKNIPTLEDVVQPGETKPNKATKAISKTKAKAAAPAPEKKAPRKSSDRRETDRRKEETSPPEGKTERRTTQRRDGARRSDDKYVKETLDQLAEKIMQDMMPDLEQHLFMQLRFELQKYVPKILSEFKDKDDK